MIEYYYAREIINDSWDIDNPERIDAEGNQIYLSKEVEDLLPNYHFVLYCDGDNAKFIFDNELSDDEKNTLDTCVYNHKNNL